MRFAETELPVATPGIFGLDVPQAMIARLIDTALLALVALIAILLIGRPVAKRLAISLMPQPALAARGAVPVTDAQGKQVLDQQGKPMMVAMTAAGAAALASPGDEEMLTLSRVDGAIRASSVQKLIDLVNKQPDEALGVVRRWLTPEEAE